MVKERIVTKNNEITASSSIRSGWITISWSERIHLLLIADASTGLADVVSGQVKEAPNALSAIKRRHASQKSR